MKKSFASGTGTPGATLVFSLTATNNGNQGAAGVTLTETVPANTTFSAAASSPGWACSTPTAGSACTLSLGTLAGGGASIARSFALVVDNPLPAGVTSVQNTACAASGSLQSCDSATVPTNGAPSLSLKKTLSSGTGAPGSTLVYALTVTNSGNQAAANLTLTETVPADTTFVPASSASGWTCTPDNNASATCALTIPNLAGGGAKSTILFAVQIAKPLPAGVTQIANTACLKNGSADAGCDQITTPSTGHPILEITKSLTAGTPAPGNTLTYTLTVTNSGDQDAAGVTLSDQLPPNTTFAPALSSPGWTCSPTNLSPSTCSVSVGRPGRPGERIPHHLPPARQSLAGRQHDPLEHRLRDRWHRQGRLLVHRHAGQRRAGALPDQELLRSAAQARHSPDLRPRGPQHRQSGRLRGRCPGDRSGQHLLRRSGKLSRLVVCRAGCGVALHPHPLQPRPRADGPCGLLRHRRGSPPSGRHPGHQQRLRQCRRPDPGCAPRSRR